MRCRACIAGQRCNSATRVTSSTSLWSPTSACAGTAVIAATHAGRRGSSARLDLQVDALDLVLDALQALHLLLLALPLLGQLGLLLLQPLQRARPAPSAAPEPLCRAPARSHIACECFLRGTHCRHTTLHSSSTDLAPTF